MSINPRNAEVWIPCALWVLIALITIPQVMSGTLSPWFGLIAAVPLAVGVLALVIGLTFELRIRRERRAKESDDE